MDYGLNIVASVKGQARLDSTLKTIGQIRNLAKDIAPIDFGTKKAGAFGDEIRKAKKELDDLGRKVTNAMQKGDKTTGLFSSTLAGATGQARAFGTALDNLNFNKNAAEAQNYANALAQAEAKAETLAATQNKLIMSARQQAGVAVGPATTLGSPEAVAQQVRFESAQIEKGNRLREQQVNLVERINTLASNKVRVDQFNNQVAKINLALEERRVDAAEEMTEELRDQIRKNETIISQNKKKKKGAEEEATASKKITGRQRAGNILQGALLGGGFPLLFGGPSFSAVGGLAGGAIGGGIGPTGRPGFAGGIAGSVVGGVFDQVIKSALELGKALENPTKNLQALTDQLPISGTATKGLIEQLEGAGLKSVAAALALETLNDELDKLGLDTEDIRKFKEQTQEFDNAFKRLKIASSALASQGLINFMTLLTKLATVFKENTNGIVQGIRALGGLVIGDDQPLAEKIGMGSGITVPPGPLASAADAGPLKKAASKVDSSMTEQEIRAQQILADLAERQVKLAAGATAVEQHRLDLIRGRLAEANAILGIDRAEINLIRAQLNVEAETNGALKEQLKVKRDIAQAELDQAIAAKDNATTLRIQADAAFELERRRKVQAEEMKDLQAGIAAEQAIRAISPFQNENFLADPYFGNSRKLESEQNVRFTETLKLMNAQLDDVNKNIKLGTQLSDDDKRALQDKRIELENNIARYKEYQPAIDEAALAQMRFNEAMAITVPVTDAVFDNLLAVVDGTKTAKEAFADFLRSISQLLMDAAKQMIATYISIGIARTFAGMGSDAAGSQGNPFGTDVFVPGAGGSAVGGGRMPLAGYADGGYVSGPTNALIGEGGQGEYVIPESKMRESMARYSRGARGSSVIPESGESGTVGGDGGGTAIAAPIDVRYTVERINDVEYVTAAQFQAGMQQAAAQGAQRGEQQTLRRLQMSGSTRRRIGL